MPRSAAKLTMMFDELPLPDRHEPDEGEINYRRIFRLPDEPGYPSRVGCEYRPRGRTEDGLGWQQALR